MKPLDLDGRNFFYKSCWNIRGDYQSASTNYDPYQTHSPIALHEPIPILLMLVSTLSKKGTYPKPTFTAKLTSRSAWSSQRTLQANKNDLAWSVSSNNHSTDWNRQVDYAALSYSDIWPHGALYRQPSILESLRSNTDKNFSSLSSWSTTWCLPQTLSLCWTH